MAQYGTWTPYAGAEAVRLALALFVIAGTLAFGALKLQGRWRREAAPADTRSRRPAPH
jgi:hypothetical protein